MTIITSKTDRDDMKRYIIAAMAVMFALAGVSCTEESEYTFDDSRFETSIELGVNEERITVDARLSIGFDGSLIDYFVIPVYSNTSWTAELVGNPSWASIDKHAGEGCDYIYFTYTSNTSTEADTQERSTILRLETARKRVEMEIVQLGSERVNE